MTKLSKLWTISVLIEPMLLFVLKEGTGVGSNVSRIFQFIVLLAFALKFLARPNFRLKLESRKLWQPYVLLVGYVLIITVMSFLLGGYSGGVNAEQQTSLEVAFKSNQVRPFVETVNLLYQFVYFIVLAPFFLRNRKDFDFFFKCAFALLFVHFTLGWIDFFLSLNGFYWIPRHLADGRAVGQRFHGIAGEPRDAAIYMMSLPFFYSIYSFYKKGTVERAGWPIILLVVASAFATVSASFIVALAFSMVLVFFYFLPRLSFVKILPITVVLAFVAGAMIYAIEHQGRINAYYTIYVDMLVDLYQYPYQELPDLIRVSYNNVFPVIHLFRDVVELNPFPLLFGSGLGSSGVVNSLVSGAFENPNNQFVRFVYEYGVIGFGLFFFVFFKILRRCSIGLDRVDRDTLFVSALIMLGGVLAHRTAVWLIWLGLLCAVSIYRQRIMIASVSCDDDREMRMAD